MAKTKTTKRKQVPFESDGDTLPIEDLLETPSGSSEEGPTKPKLKKFSSSSSSGESRPKLKAAKSMEPVVVTPLDIETRNKLGHRLCDEHNATGFPTSPLLPMDTDGSSSSFRTHDVTNDCSSLYRSISYLLFETESYYNSVREAVLSTMRSHRDVMDRAVCIETNRRFRTVDSYIGETGAGRWGRMSGGRIELKAVAMYFNANVYLFSDPITSKPLRLKPVGSAATDRAFVLFSGGKYVRPVMKFDGEKFNHTDETRNINIVPLRTGNIQYAFTVERLKVFSTMLCTEAVANSPLYVGLSVHNLGRFDKFIKGLDDEVGLSVELFNFANKYQAYSLAEFMMYQFKHCEHAPVLVDFLDGVDQNGQRYMAELIEHFEDVCDATVDAILACISPKTHGLQKHVDQVLRRRAAYSASTSSVTVALKNGEHAFRDAFPYTVLCMNVDDKSVKYFSGPKPDNQRWIDIHLNRRLMAALKDTDPRHVLFHDADVYFYAGVKDGRHQYGRIEDVFDPTTELDYYQLPKTKKPIQSVQLVLTDRGMPCLVDPVSKQVFALSTRTWQNLEENDLAVVRVGTELDEYVFGEGHRILMRKGGDIFARESALSGICNGVGFQYTVTRHRRELFVVKRLADQHIYDFDEKKRIETDLLVHYEIPAARDCGENCVYALADTRQLNVHVAKSVTARFGPEELSTFMQSNLSVDEVGHVMAVVGIPYSKYSKALPSADHDHVAAARTILTEWYNIVQSLDVSSTAPARLLAWAFRIMMKPEVAKRLSSTDGDDGKWQRLTELVREQYKNLSDVEEQMTCDAY